jgi:Holliday junction resolvase RusA-like endonuclease
VDKLARSVLDALSAVAYDDDAQVISLEAIKRYGPDDRTFVELSEVLP